MRGFPAAKNSFSMDLKQKLWLSVPVRFSPRTYHSHFGKANVMQAPNRAEKGSCNECSSFHQKGPAPRRKASPFNRQPFKSIKYEAPAKRVCSGT